MSEEMANEASAAAAVAQGGRSKDAWRTWATAWELLSVSFTYPTNDLVGAVASGEWAAAANELATVLKLDVPDGVFDGMEDYAGVSEGELMHRLRTDATRLFVGAPSPVASPYEGVWRAADDGVQPLLFVNPHSMDVERFLGQCGLGHPEGTNEPLDHVATECSLLEFLAGVEAGIMELPEGKTTESLPEGSAAAAYSKFLQDHPRTWASRFAEKTGDEAREPFFRAAAKMLAAVLEAA